MPAAPPVGMRAALICLCAVRQSTQIRHKQAPQCLRSLSQKPPGTVSLAQQRRRRDGVNCRDRDGGLKEQLLRGNLQPWPGGDATLSSAPYSSSRQCIHQCKRGSTNAMHVCSAFNRYLLVVGQCLEWNTRSRHCRASMDIPAQTCHVVWLEE